MSVPSTPQRIARTVSSGAWTPTHFLASYSPAPSRGVSGESAIGVTPRVPSEITCPIFGTTTPSRSISCMLPGSFPIYGMTEEETVAWNSLPKPPVPTLVLPVFPYGFTSASRFVSNTPAFCLRGTSGLPLAPHVSHRTEVHPSVLQHPSVSENETDDEDETDTEDEGETTEVATPPAKRPRLETPATPVATRRSQRIR